MTFMTKSELSALYFSHDKGTAILEVFLAEVRKINAVRREESNFKTYYGQPYFSDELVCSMWYMDSPTKLFLPEAWSGDGLDLPIEVLTGELTPDAYVAHLWIEFEQKQREQEQSSKERKLNELKRYAEQYPQEAAQIIANINLGV